MDCKGPENVGEASSTGELPSKRPYKTPRLRRLGSVRELTLGTTMGAFVDAQSAFMVGSM